MIIITVINIPKQLRSDSNDSIPSGKPESGVKLASINRPGLSITKISRPTNVTQTPSSDPLPSKAQNGDLNGIWCFILFINYCNFVSFVAVPTSEQLHSDSNVQYQQQILSGEQVTPATDSEATPKEDDVSTDAGIDENHADTFGSETPVPMEIDDSIGFKQDANDNTEGDIELSDAIDDLSGDIGAIDENQE